MRLSAVALDPSSTLNSLKYINQAVFSSGDTGEMWIQLVDLDSPLAPNWYSRYMPASGATLQIAFYSNNDANAFIKTASQPIASDPSVWKITLSASDTAKMAGVNVSLKLTEGANVKNAAVKNIVFMNPQSQFQC